MEDECFPAISMKTASVQIQHDPLSIKDEPSSETDSNHSSSSPSSPHSIYVNASDIPLDVEMVSPLSLPSTSRSLTLFCIAVSRQSGSDHQIFDGEYRPYFSTHHHPAKNPRHEERHHPIRTADDFAPQSASNATQLQQQRGQRRQRSHVTTRFTCTEKNRRDDGAFVSNQPPSHSHEAAHQHPPDQHSTSKQFLLRRKLDGKLPFLYLFCEKKPLLKNFEHLTTFLNSIEPICAF